MRRYYHISRVLVWITAFVALIPLGRLVTDWLEFNRMLAGSLVQVPSRGFDWVLWQEDEGIISASYVQPQGPAAAAGIREGDVFFTLEYQQFFNADDLIRAIEGIPPGSVRTYHVQRGGEFVEASVRITRYPTFLYPLSSALWRFSVWGFLVAAFVHVVGLIIAVPLTLRSRTAQFSLMLIVASSMWIFSNLARLLLIEFFGPPLSMDGPYDRLFQTLTGIGLIGWIGFPVLLLHKVYADTYLSRGMRAPWSRNVIYLPAIVLGAMALIATMFERAGPLTIDGLTAPILFYACCYIATAGALMLMYCLARPHETQDRFAGWSRWGSGIVLGLALLFGLSVLGVVPIFGAVTDNIAGWLIVGAQLLSVVPIVLVAQATLQHGKVDQVLSRSLTYVIVSGLLFFTFVGGMSLIEPYVNRMEVSSKVVAGLLAVVLLVGMEWLFRRFKGYGMSLFAGERRTMYQSVQQLQEQMRSILDYDTLVQRTIEVVGSNFGARSAVIFLRPDGPSGPWYSANYHPEPPYLTERVVSTIWPYLTDSRAIWARNAELNESRFPDSIHELLVQRGAAILVPIVGDSEPIGVIVLGMKRQRRSVYNLEEVDLLRSLSGQLALAVARLSLVERERMLVRQSAEAQLVALRAQINPHFLFNSLNTIVSLIEEHPEEAEEVVEHLACIFRYVLKTGSREFVPLEDELELVRHYLSIEKSRFGGALIVEQEVDPDCRLHPVPAFAVQTLVENAVKHGLATRRGGGTIRLSCRLDGEMVLVRISDSGVGIPDLFDKDGPVSDEQTFFGIGLKNISTRLRQIYGRSDLLRFESRPEKGTSAELCLPIEYSDAPSIHGARAETNGTVRASEDYGHLVD